MNTERMKILEMLKEGRINAEEADRLLDTLERLDQPQQDDVVVDSDDPDNGHNDGGIRAAVAEALRTAAAAGRSARATIRTVRERHSAKRARALAISVKTHDGKNVNVRLPLALVRAGVKLTALLPESAAEALKDKGINLDAMADMDTDELLESLNDLNINIETPEGDTVTICCE